MTISLEMSLKKLVRLTAQTLRGRRRMEEGGWSGEGIDEL